MSDFSVIGVSVKVEDHDSHFRGDVGWRWVEVSFWTRDEFNTQGKIKVSIPFDGLDDMTLSEIRDRAITKARERLMIGHESIGEASYADLVEREANTPDYGPPSEEIDFAALLDEALAERKGQG